MSDPFRDGVEAALERAERLAEENEDLRSEVDELRRAHVRVEVAPAPSRQPRTPDPLADATLEHLQELTREREAREPAIAPIVPAAAHAHGAGRNDKVDAKLLGRSEVEVNPAVLEPRLKGRPLGQPKIDRGSGDPIVDARVAAAYRKGIAVGAFVTAAIALGFVLLLVRC